MQRTIQELCTQLLATTDPVAAQAIADELRGAIHELVEELRQKINEIPAVIEPLDLAG